MRAELALLLGCATALGFASLQAAEPGHALRQEGAGIGNSITKRLEPMTIANQASFGGFFSLGIPGIYRLRFEARRPGMSQAAAAEFEYRVSPEGRR